MKVFNNLTKLVLFPAYYLIHKNIFFGLIQKYIIRKFYYKNFRFDLNVENIPVSFYSSFLFKTYEYNDRKLVERYIDKNNKCIIIGGGLGFIPTIAYHNSKNKMLVFEINNKIIKNLEKNLINNNCDFTLFEKNLTIENEKKKSSYYKSDNFLATSQYLKTKNEFYVDNIFKDEIKNFNEYNTLIIDGEGIEEYFVKNLEYLKNIKYLIFELHHNIFNKEEISLIFKKLEEHNFMQIDKCFNSYIFMKDKS